MSETTLYRLRKERNMTQAQLAAASGVHVQAIAKLERGERNISNIQLSTALALADALGVDPHRLLED